MPFFLLNEDDMHLECIQFLILSLKFENIFMKYFLMEHLGLFLKIKIIFHLLLCDFL